MRARGRRARPKAPRCGGRLAVCLAFAAIACAGKLTEDVATGGAGGAGGGASGSAGAVGGAGVGGTGIGGAGIGGTANGPGGGSAGIGGRSNGGAAGNGGASGAGASGGTCSFWSAPCPPDQFCSCAGTCAKRPTTCATECQPVCGCGSGPYCNTCIAQYLGDDASEKPYTMCSNDGGGPGVDAGVVGVWCSYTTECNFGLKCCYQCPDGAGCGSRCTEPDGNGSCPPL